tara:strand:+ start:1163 stop:1615 length:453 start_codon:yes stop_codon:yes gene_type:complete
MIKELTQIEVDSVIKDDPVRPHIPSQFRTLGNNTVYALYEDKYAEFDEPSDDIRAVICVAYTNKIPTNEQELQSFPSGDIAVFYTVWSYSAGAGREIVNAVALTLKDTEKANKFVTLSPLTKMAHRFHISNGAQLLAKHNTCQNFEYVAK